MTEQCDFHNTFVHAGGHPTGPALPDVELACGPTFSSQGAVIETMTEKPDPILADMNEYKP